MASTKPRSPSSRAASVDQAGYVQGARKWIIALTASLAALVEIIDTSIVNVALKDIQTNLGATISEVGWVVTAYAIANVILIPLSAWLGQRFGQKRYFIFSLIGFTIASVLCGFSVSLPMLIGSRILQGLCGGGLLAKGQTILYETFPPAEQGVAQGLFGVVALAGPAIGPTLGGYLTDALGWRWIFFVNLPLGILAVIMAIIFLQPDRPTTVARQRVDWWGIGLLAVSIGSLQTFLEEGEKDGWFESQFIIGLAIASVVGLILFIWQELRVKNPAVNLRVLRHRSLAAGSLFFGVLGMGLYGILFSVPLFAQTILGFSATQTGWLLAPGALCSALFIIPFSRLTTKIDKRLLVGIGAIGTALVAFQLANITPQTGTDQLFYPLIWRGLATVMMFVPLSMATLGDLPKSEVAAGAGFSNLTRQLGGSIGIAVITTVLEQRAAFHKVVLLAHLSAADPQTQQRLSSLTSLFQSKGADPATANLQAIAILEQMINKQVAVLAYADVYRIVGLIFLCALPLVMFLGKGTKGKVEMGH